MELKGKHVLAITDNDFEDLEMWYPVHRLREAGAEVVVAGPEANETYKGKYGVPIQTDMNYADAQSSHFDAFFVPGGWAPDRMRRDSDVLRLTREFHEGQKPIAHICHGGWVLVSADICRGYKMTSTPGIKDDLRNAGAEWVDEEVVVDRHIVSGRRPPDLPAFMREFIRLIQHGI